MADKRDEKYNDDHSNAVMTHTSEAIPASDFIRSKNGLGNSCRGTAAVNPSSVPEDACSIPGLSFYFSFFLSVFSQV